MGELCIKKHIGWADTFQDDLIEMLKLHCLCKVNFIVYSIKKIFRWRKKMERLCRQTRGRIGLCIGTFISRDPGADSGDNAKLKE